MKPGWWIRPPDVTIGPRDDLYLSRWYVIPRNRLFNVYLHHFRRSDDDRALHDHPWWNVSIVLRGSYVEVTPNGRRLVRVGRPVPRHAVASHRVELIAGAPVWSLFISGPKIREWGFHCPQGWRRHQDFIATYEGGNEIGRGCE